MSFHFIVFSGGESDKEKNKIRFKEKSGTNGIFAFKNISKKDQELMFKILTFLISQTYMEAESDGKNQSCKKEQDTDVVTPTNTELDWMKPSSFVPDFAVDIKVWVCSKFRLSNPKTFVFAFSLFFFARDCRLKLVFFLPIYMYKERHS